MHGFMHSKPEYVHTKHRSMITKPEIMHTNGIINSFLKLLPFPDGILKKFFQIPTQKNVPEFWAFRKCQKSHFFPNKYA